MNPLIREAAESVQLGWLMGIMTVVFFLVFLFWVWYAYAPSHQAGMDEASRMPLEDGGNT